MSKLPERPICVLVAALGGEGGGVLSGWLIAAAEAAGFPVQGTSIPGVAQRTGATTYYIEVYPVPRAELGGREPVLALTPTPGNVDVMVTSELLEAGRAMQRGYVSPERTVLVGSTSRVYAIAEKSAMADGRYDGERIVAAARKVAKRCLLFDMEATARQAGSALNAVLLGVIAGAELLPIARDRFEAAIRAAGIAVDSNLAGFAAGLAMAQGKGEVRPLAAKAPPSPAAPDPRFARRIDAYPDAARAIAARAVARLTDYQDPAYAELYLERLDRVAALDRATAGGADGSYKLTAECGRYLALLMSYEDVIRVADLKTRASRLAAVRAEVGARPDEPVAVTEFLKPGLDEFCSVLPRALAGPLRRLAERRGVADRLNIGLAVRTTSVAGFLSLWLVAKLRRWRRGTARYVQEQALIAHWLDAVQAAAGFDYELALEVVECARLVKGYGETHRRGLGNFLRLMEGVIEPALDAGTRGAAGAVAKVRAAALGDPEGKSLARTLADLGPTPAETPVPAAVAGE